MLLSFVYFKLYINSDDTKIEQIIYLLALSFVRGPSSEFGAITSNDPLDIHHRFMVSKGFGEHTNMMNINSPCSAIKTSKIANGDIASASFPILAFK